MTSTNLSPKRIIFFLIFILYLKNIGYSQVEILPNQLFYEVKESYDQYIDTLDISDSILYHEGGFYDTYQHWLKYWEPRLHPHGRFDYYSQSVYNSILSIDTHFPQFRSSSVPNQTRWNEVGPIRKPENGINSSAFGVGPVSKLPYGIYYFVTIPSKAHGKIFVP